jgi:predicted MPP superfamily phosphohydrolase
MRGWQMIVFLAIVLSIYGLINFYILKREWQATASLGTARSFIFALSLFLVLAYPLGRFVERILPGAFVEFFDRVGSFYLVVMLYSLLFIFIIDILRLGNAVFSFFPKAIARHPHQAGLVTFFVVLGMVLAIVSYGVINAAHPRLRTLDVTIDKPAGTLQKLKIVLASDFHLGTTNRNAWLEKVVAKINALQPDLVVLPGDIVDMYVPRAGVSQMIATLQKISAPLGVFSVTGNHEYYGGLKQNLQYLARARVRVLQDEALKIDDGFYLIGRKDRTALSFGETRKTLKEILNSVDSTLPLILLDHQPYRLQEAEDAGIDLQLSGHTHAGQLIPLNWINKKVWEQYWGYLRKGKTQYYVSCGVGTWGPPARTGSTPEIIEIRLTFNSGLNPD